MLFAARGLLRSGVMSCVVWGGSFLSLVAWSGVSFEFGGVFSSSGLFSGFAMSIFLRNAILSLSDPCVLYSARLCVCDAGSLSVSFVGVVCCFLFGRCKFVGFVSASSSRQRLKFERSARLPFGLWMRMYFLLHSAVCTDSIRWHLHAVPFFESVMLWNLGG